MIDDVEAARQAFWKADAMFHENPTVAHSQAQVATLDAYAAAVARAARIAALREWFGSSGWPHDSGRGSIHKNPCRACTVLKLAEAEVQDD